MDREKGMGRNVSINVKTEKKISELPFFGMKKDMKFSVEEEMRQLRGTRFGDIGKK